MYPVMLDLRGRVVLVVGAGPIATRKADGLVGEGAHVRVVAPEISPDMATFAAFTQTPSRSPSSNTACCTARSFVAVMTSRTPTRSPAS